MNQQKYSPIKYSNYRQQSYMANGTADLKLTEIIKRSESNISLQATPTYVSTIYVKSTDSSKDANTNIWRQKNPITVGRQYKRTVSDEVNQNTRVPSTYLQSLPENATRTRITYNDKALTTRGNFIGKPYYNVGKE